MSPLNILLTGVNFLLTEFYFQGFTYPVRAHFLENILEVIGYRLTPHNQIDDYGQEKAWKMQKQAQALKKRKTQIASSVEVYRHSLFYALRNLILMVPQLVRKFICKQVVGYCLQRKLQGKQI